jgi:hypothetical protein
VHNDLASRPPTGREFPADIWNCSGEIVDRCPDRLNLAIALERWLTGDVAPKLQTQDAHP